MRDKHFEAMSVKLKKKNTSAWRIKHNYLKEINDCK